MGLFSWMSTKASNQGGKLKGFARRITSADELEKNGQFIVGMVQQLSSSPDEVVQETFENAYQRLGITEESLAKTYNSLMMRFNIFIFAAVLAIVLGGWYAYIGSWAALGIIGVLFYCAAQLFIASFRMLQIRRRELVPVSYWLAVPGQWWPTAFKPLRRSSGSGKKPPQSLPKDSSGRVVNLNDRRNRPNKD